MGLTMAELCSEERPSWGAVAATGERVWLAAYTRSQHESAVARQLRAKSLPCLLPTFVRPARWSDRVRKLETPLFPGYVFVNVIPDERMRVLQTPGVVNIVSAFGHPAPLCDADVALLRECAARPQRFQPHAFLQVGQRVRVTCGPFAGWEGILCEKKNSTRLVVSLQQIMRSVAVDLDGADVEAVPCKPQAWSGSS